MITYTFTVPGGQPEKKIEAMSLKKAMKSFQGGEGKSCRSCWSREVKQVSYKEH